MRSRLARSGEELFDYAVMAAEHGDGQVAKTHVLGKHGQQRLDDARTKSVADHHAVDVAGIERARRAFDAERADEADAFADGDGKLRIGAAAAGDQHGRLFERVAVRQFRDGLAARGERLHAAQNRAVQRADARCRGEPPRDAAPAAAFAEIVSASGIGAAPSSRMRAMTGVKAPIAAVEPIGERAGKFIGALAIAARLGEDHGFGFDRRDGGDRISPVRLDDRKGARGT